MLIPAAAAARALERRTCQAQGCDQESDGVLVGRVLEKDSEKILARDFGLVSKCPARKMPCVNRGVCDVTRRLWLRLL